MEAAEAAAKVAVEEAVAREQARVAEGDAERVKLRKVAAELKR